MRGVAVFLILGLMACVQRERGREPSVLETPRIQSFTVVPGRVKVGEEAMVEVRYTGGEGRIDPDVGLLDGRVRVPVRPWATRSYTLTVQGARGGLAHRTLTVAVDPALIIRVTGDLDEPPGVEVEGPHGFHRSLRGGALLHEVPAGEYTITTQAVQRRGVTLHPWQPRQRVMVETGTKVDVCFPEPDLQIELPRGITLDLVLIPAGRFQMGTDDPEELLSDRWPRPIPVHPVEIPKAFYMARHLTTRVQWWAVTGGDPARMPANPEFPMEGLSFDEVRERFLPALNQVVPGHAFRLPSEAEWEFACRAGTRTRYFFGPDDSGIDDYFWRQSTSGQALHPVGQKKPNPWGLYDLGGMCYQWCEDIPHDDYHGAPADGGPWLGSGGDHRYRILRGGDPYLDSGRSGKRIGLLMATPGPFLGVRIVGESGPLVGEKSGGQPRRR